MKRSVSLLMALIVIVGCVAFMPSCSTPDNAGQSVNIVENGEAQYAVVYSVSCSDAVFDVAAKLANGISALTGVSISLINDADASVAPEDRYIIVGDSVFEESAAAKATLGDCADAYAIERADSGNIVLVSNYDDCLDTAADYYLDNLMVSNFDTSTATLTFEGCYYDGTDTLPDGFNFEDLAKTKIVYATNLDGYRYVAETLQNAIRDVYKLDVPVYSDEEKGEAAREILIGETDRTLSATTYADHGYIMEYELIAYRGSLQLACGGSFSARKAMDKLVAELFTSANASKVLSAGTYTSGAMLETHSGYISRSSDTDARIMTLNIMPAVLGEEEYPGVLPVRERAEIFAGLLISYKPDVVGLQEADERWQQQLPHYMDELSERYDLGYKMVLDIHNGWNNYTPIIYRADIYDVLECKHQHYDYHTTSANSGERYLRGASQLVLQNKTDATEKFVVINSHWDHGGQTSTANPQYMNECATSEAGIVEGYKAKYPGVRIFCIGDFNSHRYNNVFFNKFLEDINGLAADEVARSNGTLDATGGYHASGKLMVDEEGKYRKDFGADANTFIDHVVYTASSSSVKTTVKKHDTAYHSGGYHHILSDHCAVFADLKFG